MNQPPSIGRIVTYILTAQDAATINSRPVGAFSGHNHANPGDEYPAMIVRDWGDRHVNLQVFYDGDGTIWATSRTEGVGPGHWHWPLRV